MPAAIVGISHNESASGGTTIAATRTITQGNGVIVLITHDTNVNTILGASSVSDGTTTLGTSDATFNGSNIGQLVRSFNYPNHTGGSFTFTCTFPASVAARGIYIIEVSNMATSAAYDTTTGSQASTNAPTAGPVTPANNGSIAIAFVVDSVPITLTDGSFTELLNEPTIIDCEIAGKVQAIAAAITPTWSMGSASGWATFVAIYKAAPDAPPLQYNKTRPPLNQRVA